VDFIRTRMPEEHVLIVTASEVDKRSAFFKFCKEHGEIHEFAVPDRDYKLAQQAASRLTAELARAGLTMSPDAQAAFLEKVGADTRQIVNEVEKLATYAGERTAIQRKDVDEIVCFTREAAAWDLADALGRRELARGLDLLHQLIFRKESPIYLVQILAGRIRDLTIYRECLDRGWLKAGGRGSSPAQWQVPPRVAAVFTELFVKDPRATHPYRVGLLAEQARRFTLQQLRMCRQAAIETHEKMVSSRVPQSMLLELLMVRMLS
jgi:DNA polymerase III subunit delta